MRRNHLKLWLAIGVVAISISIVVLAIIGTRPSGLTDRTFEEIQLGMTTKDAERITGMKRDQNLPFPMSDYNWSVQDDFNFPSHAFAYDNVCIIISVDQDEVIYAKKFGRRRGFWPGWLRWLID